ncbi:MAG: hypothetical protein WB679_25595, partial [Terracidiphilus sp.]
VMPLMLIGFIVLRLWLQVSVPIERGMVFPMALVPAFWGIWNVLWIGSHARTHMPIGLHGALLPLLLMPGGAAITSCLGILALGSHDAIWFQTLHIPYALILPMFMVALAAYYLVWKYVVGFLNHTLGIA